MENIRTVAERAAQHLTENPDAGAEVDSPATATLEKGLRFRIEGPKGEIATDMAQSVGGAASAPSPGWLMRAALASCDASLIAIEAARDRVELTTLEVVVESDSDSRGLLGVADDVPAGPLAVRTRISVAGADEERLREIVARALRRSPVKDALERPVEVATEVAVAERRG